MEANEQAGCGAIYGEGDLMTEGNTVPEPYIAPHPGVRILRPHKKESQPKIFFDDNSTKIC